MYIYMLSMKFYLNCLILFDEADTTVLQRSAAWVLHAAAKPTHCRCDELWWIVMKVWQYPTACVATISQHIPQTDMFIVLIFWEASQEVNVSFYKKLD